MFRHVSSFLKAKKHKFILGALTLLLVDALNLAVPKVTEIITDFLVVKTGGVGADGVEVAADSLGGMAAAAGYQVWHFGLAILIIGLGIALTRFLWRIIIFINGIHFESFLRLKLFAHWLKMPQSYFNRVQTGDLMARATNDVMTLRRASSQGLIAIVDAVFITIISLTTMIVDVDPRMTLIAVLPLPFILISILLTTKKMFRYSKAAQEGFSNLSGKAQESFSGIRVIKSFAQEEQELKDFNVKSKDNMKKRMKLIGLFALLQPVVTFVSTLSLVFALTIGSKYVINGTITLGKFVAFFQYLELLTWPMMAFGFFIAEMQGGAASLQRLNEVFDEKSELDDHSTGEEVRDTSIEIENLTFTYPGEERPAVRDISLSIPSGSTLGIIGRTGSGKTTLISLLLKLYNVPRGTIKVGGVDICDLSIHELREMFGVVPQDNFLFSTTIADNIALSSEEIDMAKVEKTAEEACVAKDIREFPEGFDTMLGERGVNLSGGQKQRTSIARMLYKEGKINILDDSLSAVDTITEAEIIENMEKKRGKENQDTNIIISHRISSIISADNIIVLEDGKIAEMGTHDELVARGGFYADVFKKQKLEEKISSL